MSISNAGTDWVCRQAPSCVGSDTCHDQRDAKLDDRCRPMESSKPDELSDESHNRGNGGCGSETTVVSFVEPGGSKGFAVAFLTFKARFGAASLSSSSIVPEIEFRSLVPRPGDRSKFSLHAVAMSRTLKPAPAWSCFVFKGPSRQSLPLAVFDWEPVQSTNTSHSSKPEVACIERQRNDGALPHAQHILPSVLLLPLAPPVPVLLAKIIGEET